MNYVIKSIAVLVFALVPVLSYGTNRTTFMPDNNLYLEDNVNLVQNVTQSDFNSVIDLAYKFYAPIVKRLGGNLVIKKLWSDSTVNAQTSRQGNNWVIEMFGGLARRPEVTKDGFALVLCHEIGHNLGGFPYVQDWASAEGQSDYYSTHACAKYLWQSEGDNGASSEIGYYGRTLCDNAWTSDRGRIVCYRSILGGQSLGSLLGALNGESSDIESPDPTVVSRTNTSYPGTTQCRLDTYVAGAVCVANWDYNIIPSTEQTQINYLCSSGRGYTSGDRPKCWFKARVFKED